MTTSHVGHRFLYRTWRYVFLAAMAVLLSARHSYGDQTQKQEVHTRMNELVDSVNEAVHNADAAVDKKQVIDLGQSLSLLEAKFSGLRSALAQEMGVNMDKLSGHSTVSRELMDKSTQLVRGVVAQREELRKLTGDLRETDSAIRALREGLTKFETEMASLNRIMGDVHQAHNDLSSAHDEIKNRVTSITTDSSLKSKRSSNRFMFVLLFVEVVALVVYLYFKRPGQPSVHKAYGKFG